MAGSALSRVAVVGAGLAGLAAALELRRLGFEVEIFERSRLVGGKATSFWVDGVEVDSGQHVFLGCFEHWLAFVRELGLEGELALQNRFEVLVLGPGGIRARLKAADLPAPWHLLPALLGHRLLGLRGRLQLVRALSRARRPVDPRSTVAEWLRELGQGRWARAAFWDLFLVPALNAPLEQVSAEAGRFVVLTAFLGGPAACRIGWSRVPLARIAEAAAARASALHLRTPVTALEVSDGRAVGLRTPAGTRTFEGVVLAVPPRALARILGEPQRVGVAGLEAIREQPILDVHLWYEGGPELLEPGFAALVGSPVQWVFEKAPGYLCCSLSAASELVRRPAAELVELCRMELESALPELRRHRLARSAVTRDPQATFVAEPGLHRPKSSTWLPNLVLAGAWTATGWPATMESAVRSGRTAARLLASRLEDRVASAAEAVAG